MIWFLACDQGSLVGRLCVQDYKSLKSLSTAFKICSTVVNIQTDVHIDSTLSSLHIKLRQLS